MSSVASGKRGVQALNETLHAIFAERDDVVLFGEDVLDPYGGAFKVTQGLSDAYPDRVLTTPISEASLFGVAAGMALRGRRPILEIMFGDFIALGFDQIVNGIAKFREMYDDQVTVPLVVKLSPDFEESNERDIIPAVLEAGIDVINYGNARRIDEPRLSQGAGGLSGPAIFPATLEHVRRTRARFGDAVDIIATGGVDDPAKARALLQEGATAVGYFTGFITQGPLLARRILDDVLRDRLGRA